MKPAPLVCSFLLSAQMAVAHDNVADICAGAAAIAAPVVESSERMNLGLTVIRVTGTPKDRDAASELHKIYSETMTKMVAAMGHVAELCEAHN